MKRIITSLLIATVAFSDVASAKTETDSTAKSGTKTAKHTPKATDPSPTDAIETRRFKKQLESAQIPPEKVKSKLPPVETQATAPAIVEDKGGEAVKHAE